MKENIVIIEWQDIYTADNATLEEVKKDLDTHARYVSIGRLVHEDKRFVVLLQNDAGQKSDFIVIPKAVILKRRILK